MTNRIPETLFTAGGRREQVETQSPPPLANFQLPSGNWQEWVGQVKEMVASNPGLGLAVALGTGILIGWWVKRK